MKSGFIKSSWISMHPYERMNAKFWLKVLEAIRAEGTDINDDNALENLIKRVQNAYSDDQIKSTNEIIAKKKEKLVELEYKTEQIRKVIKKLEERGW